MVDIEIVLCTTSSTKASWPGLLPLYHFMEHYRCVVVVVVIVVVAVVVVVVAAAVGGVGGGSKTVS